MKVVEARKRPQRWMDPPKVVRGHPWAPLPTAHASLFIDARVGSELTEAAVQSGKRGKETLGLLLGDSLRAPASEARFTVALSQVTSPVEATATHVRFDRERFEAMAQALDAQAFDYLIVGWYHTHVGLGCFMSPTDLRTQDRYFRLPHQFALVLDPVRKEAAAFTREVDVGKGVPFALFENGTAGGPDYRKPR